MITDRGGEYPVSAFNASFFETFPRSLPVVFMTRLRLDQEALLKILPQHGEKCCLEGSRLYRGPRRGRCSAPVGRWVPGVGFQEAWRMLCVVLVRFLVPGDTSYCLSIYVDR